jgi:glucuronate isomerase
VAAPAPLLLHPDRLLPADPGVRTIARRILEQVADLPLLAPHGHVDASMLLADAPFRDPAQLLVTSDHYVLRLLHASGVGLDALGVGRGGLDEAASRSVWHVLCDRWASFRGTPVQYWLACELGGIFGVDVRPSAATADAIYDRVAALLPTAAYRPRALFERFGIEVLATTDDPCDNLDAHRQLAADPTFAGRVIPTFRPDRYLEPGRAEWRDDVAQLGAAADVDTGSYTGYLAALEERRRYFQAHGATSADHGHLDARTDPLEAADAARIYADAVEGPVNDGAATAFRRHMIGEMARMSCDDGLTMTLHPGVLRNHHAPTARSFGPDTGHDLPVATEYTQALRPLLERYGTHPNLRLVLYSVDETVFSREVAPLAAFYPTVYIGAPWWFLDAPDAIRRFRAAVGETAGFSRSAGFVDDTRAFCSIPARHDMARRVDAGVLAGLVAEHRLDEDEAVETARDLVDGWPRAVFGL